jgi:eukaryotic-like serine/threonine-protein kinase
MQTGQTLGPFTIEREIGAGAMGAVYRAVYTKNGQRVAIKIMAPGLGSSNSHAAARFEREAAILKQFNHPNIVKLFGTGKFQGTRYYAMEYIEGESLDRLMSRRDRMTWEEVVTLGKQLCSALQHAHEHGVIHRDLKPSNLMILRDGTLKLTDFGIAKDLDVTALTSANCTVGTASYMSPEQCRGERELTHKSDLYSLGCVFYELVTGRKPFLAENAMEMFMCHVSGKPERPSRLVPELPVWFDNLICQLMEKKPEHRPKDAAMVAGVLNTIQEKVEARQSAGVEAATRKRGERPRGAPERTEEDREAARVLTGKGKRKVARPPRFYERWWFAAAGVLLVLGAMALVLYLVMRPPPLDRLYARAKPLMESKNPDEDWARAIDPDVNGPLYLFERYYADGKGEQANQMRQWAVLARKRACDQLVRRYVQSKRSNSPIKFQAQGEVQEKAFDAGWAEEEGDVTVAAQDWRKVKELAGQGGWDALADEHLQQLAALGPAEKALAKLLDDLREPEYKPSYQWPQQPELAHALRYERFGDKWRAYQEFEKLRDKYSKEPDTRFWYLFAVKKAKELKPSKETDEIGERRKLIADGLEKAKSTDNRYDARLLYMHIIALYGNDTDAKIKELVEDARAGLKDIEKGLNLKP